jgi:hypothetical protein
MIRVNITRNGNITNAAVFSTQQEAEAWVQEQTTLRSFGQPDRWLKPESPEQEAEFEATALDSRPVDDGFNPPYTEYFFEAEFQVAYLDITEQLAKEAKVQEALRAQSLGAQIIAKVWAINESKELAPEQFQAIIQDPMLQNIERLLWNGSLKTAKVLIQGLDTTMFTAEEKQEILDLLADY